MAKLPAKHQEVVLDALVVRSNDLRHAYMNGTNSVSQAALKDFDWKIQVRNYLKAINFDEFSVYVY